MGVNLFGLKVWLTFSPVHLLLYSQDLNVEQRWSTECPLCAYEGEACRVWEGEKGGGKEHKKRQRERRPTGRVERRERGHLFQGAPTEPGTKASFVWAD